MRKVTWVILVSLLVLVLATVGLIVSQRTHNEYLGQSVSAVLGIVAAWILGRIWFGKPKS